MHLRYQVCYFTALAVVSTATESTAGVTTSSVIVSTATVSFPSFSEALLPQAANVTATAAAKNNTNFYRFFFDKICVLCLLLIVSDLRDINVIYYRLSANKYRK